MVSDNPAIKPTDETTNHQSDSTHQSSSMSMLNVVKPGDFANLPKSSDTWSQFLPHDLQIVDSTSSKPADATKPADEAKPGDATKPADQLPAGEERHGNTTVKKDDQGSIKEYSNGDYTLAKHDDGKWYYHQNGDGHDFVEVKGDSIKMDEQGKVTYGESGLFGKDNQTLGDGSTGFLSSITSAASHVEDAVVNHPLDTFNSVAFMPLAAVDAIAGTHTIQAIGEIEKGAVDEVVNHPGEILKDVAIGAAIGALTVATGGGALVALGIGAAALTATELIKNKGDLGGVVDDAKALGNTVVDWGQDFATVAGSGPHTQEELAAAQQGLHEAGAFGAHVVAGAAGGAAGGVAAEAVGLSNAVPNVARAAVSRFGRTPSETVDNAIPKGAPALRSDGTEYPAPAGRDFEPGVLEAKTANLKKDLGISRFTSQAEQREKLLADLENNGPGIQISRDGDNVRILNGNTRYALAKELGIPDSEIPVRGGPDFTVKQYLRPGNGEPVTEPITLPRGVDEPVAEPITLPRGVDEPVTEPITLPRGADEPVTEPITLPRDAGEPVTEPIALPRDAGEPPSLATPREPLENQGAFTLPNGESINPNTIDIMRGSGLTQDSYLYRTMAPEYLDVENGLVAANPNSCCLIRNTDLPPRLEVTLDDGRVVKLPQITNATQVKPGLNVASGNPSGAYGADGQVLVGIRLGDALAKGGQLYRDESAGIPGAYYLTFDGSVPFYFVPPW
ncbi:MAG: hypothetical protein JST89_01555 [Cyanobacteria bacterium SZAS-4]|nr:hypothetical protein [Cyanobacteria bacterium SZAS-4]